MQPEAIELLKSLKALGARVTGSFARGEQRDISDLDIYVPYDKWSNIRELTKNTPFVWVSTALGQVATKSTSPWIELSWRFDRQREKLKKVVVFGVDFKTW